MRRSILSRSRGMSALQLSIEDWETIGYDVPLLVNMQPAGEYLGEEYYRAGGVPAVMNELLAAGRIARRTRCTINGKTHRRECRQREGDQPARHSAVRSTAEGPRGLQGAARQSVRFRDHEDERDLRRIPAALSQRSERSERVRGPRRGVRRAGGLSPAHRRSGAWHRRTHHLVHARRRRRSAIRAPPRWSTCSRPRR